MFIHPETDRSIYGQPDCVNKQLPSFENSAFIIHETPQWICVLLVQRSDCLFIFTAALLSQWVLGQPPRGAKSLQPFPVRDIIVYPLAAA